MAGKQAKILSDAHVNAALRAVRRNRHATRDRVIILLSVKAGLRAGEITKLTWPMVCNAHGHVGRLIELHDVAAKMRGGRNIPIHPTLRKALCELREIDSGDDFVVRSERGGGMSPGSVVNWFASLYRELDFDGCSSHSGRRTFITKAARSVHRAGGSIRDVQLLAGHRSIGMTQLYIDGDTGAQRRLVHLL